MKDRGGRHRNDRADAIIGRPPCAGDHRAQGIIVEERRFSAAYRDWNDPGFSP